jgi:hypothetical protein
MTEAVKWPAPQGAGFFDNPKNLLILAFGLQISAILFGLVPLVSLVICGVSIALGYVARSKLSGIPFRSNANLAMYNGIFGISTSLLTAALSIVYLAILLYAGFAIAGLTFTLMDRSTERWWKFGG